MSEETNTIEINGVKYVRQNSIKQQSTPLEGKPFVVIRSTNSGCHAGYLVSEDGDTITLARSIRLWYWDGAATLSQLAMEGVKKPENCKFAMPVDAITVYGVCEKIETTRAAQKSLEGVKSWKQ